jgi:hypothetical protein
VASRIAITLSESEQKKLKRIVKRLKLASSGQLLRMLLSGDEKVIDWIDEELKKPESLFE